MFDEKTEELAQRARISRSASRRPSCGKYLDDKVVTTRIAEEAGVECVPNVLAEVDSYESLRRASQKLGKTW